MRDACLEFALGLPYYTCGIATGTLAVGNEIQLCCSWSASLLCYITRILRVLALICHIGKYPRITDDIQ